MNQHKQQEIDQALSDNPIVSASDVISGLGVAKCYGLEGSMYRQMTGPERVLWNCSLPQMVRNGFVRRNLLRGASPVDALAKFRELLKDGGTDALKAWAV